MKASLSLIPFALTFVGLCPITQDVAAQERVRDLSPKAACRLVDRTIMQPEAIYGACSLIASMLKPADKELGTSCTRERNRCIKDMTQDVGRCTWTKKAAFRKCNAPATLLKQCLRAQAHAYSKMGEAVQCDGEGGKVLLSDDISQSALGCERLFKMCPRLGE